MTEGHWQLDGSSPELYQRYLVPAITTKWAEDLVDRAQPRAGEAVIDVACGTGVVARLAAARMASGRVTGLDLNAGMLAVARTVPSEGATIDWVEGIERSVAEVWAPSSFVRDGFVQSGVPKEFGTWGWSAAWSRNSANPCQ